VPHEAEDRRRAWHTADTRGQDCVGDPELRTGLAAPRLRAKGDGGHSRTAMLRELREEIGLTSFESAVLVSGFSHRPDYRRGEGAIFVVQGVRYEPR
jgi:8-oxo-dGTP pyrophosphatase MutT (NUDIX family)